MRGAIRKMKATLVAPAASPVSYQLPLGDALFPMDQRLGEPLEMVFTGNIFCLACGRKTAKSFAQGHCFPCFKRLAACDLCILRPETCHHHLGTCRDERWAAGHCMRDHLVYIANSSGLKVGITRATQIPTRWIDQGATQAVAIFKVRNRLHAGLIESAMKKHISDRTDWRKMLKGVAKPLDLPAAAARLKQAAAADLSALQAARAADGRPMEWRSLAPAPLDLSYPVLRYPDKVSSLSFDKTAVVGGVLRGIKGQYLLFDSGVINIRKFGGYEIEVK